MGNDLRSRVYVTSHGRQFHDPMRHYMTGSAQVQVLEQVARDNGYEPCAYCFGGEGRLPALRRDPSRAWLTLHRAGGQ